MTTNFILRAKHYYMRLRYPVSLPEEVATALGIVLPNSQRFSKVLELLTTTTPTRLFRFMPRQEAERAFKHALRKDHFHQKSLFSFYFPEGWMEFELQFDESNLLRRVYLHHKLIPHQRGFELQLSLI